MIARLAAGALASGLLATSLHAGSVDRSPRPQTRPADAVTRAALTLADPAEARAQAAFRAWIADFRPRALAAGIPAATFDAAAASARYLPDVVQRDGNQAEFTKTIWQYLDSAVSDSRVDNGRKALAEHGDTLARIESHYGVDTRVVLAVWGMETAYGTYRGDTPIVSALATLAYDGRRASFFENQLIAALEILAAGDTTPDRMTGSWAGAMGHTQFMPTSFKALAVDFTGDGRRDIWSDDPTDALASTAAYLAHHGWVAGMPWGVEVSLAPGFDFDLADGDTRRMPSDWAGLGVTGLDGAPVRDFGAARLFLPAGARGPAFLTFKNFDVIRRYNPSDAYAMGVGHLGDRIAGGATFSGAWPDDARGLTSDERRELQTRLTRAGYDTQGVDGRIGPRTVAALRAFQRDEGLAPDGYASLAILERLR
ncbi:Membrane-bound lytic murein transglycosylase B precursor [Roseivivax jejudonensis]|uniref:Membrane-bound lytic murein transglycosylase B n=1 Tax=Roseivivax jejudonensis TaxID=1529041 RepID=A0A1X6YJ52_9RHOB|nr:lytic murein transglycosylase [Roseivivax jejudonensis]SLN22892.1 Membrane-bound lytic murein transglycosylase B precursor [Roseivivax jejudonensis]